MTDQPDIVERLKLMAAELAATWVDSSAEDMRACEAALFKAFAAVRDAALEDAAAAASDATLPAGYIWGCDAMGQFKVGKRCAADAIYALKSPPSPPGTEE